MARFKVGSELHPMLGIITVTSNMIYVVVLMVFWNLQKSKTLLLNSCAALSDGKKCPAACPPFLGLLT